MNPVPASTQAAGAQRPTQAVEVIAMEMLTPVGADAVQTATSVRAGISGYRASSSYNRQHKPMTLALVPDDALPPLEDELSKLPGLTFRQQRMLQLATPPLQQLLEAFPLPTAIPLVLAGPEKLPGRRSVVSDKFLQQLQVQTQVPINLKNSYVLPSGRSGGFDALEAAMLLIEQGISQTVMVGAVDSHFDLLLLGQLDSEDRILAEGIMDGFAPAEGAAFMLVRAATEQSKIRLYPPGITEETGHRYSSAPYKGEGLAAAVSEALSDLANNPVKTVLAGFNGEHFNAKEWGVAAIRNSRKIASDHNVIHPADCLGDPGAALGLILIQLGIIGLTKGYYTGPLMAWCSSELAPRGAICIS